MHCNAFKSAIFCFFSQRNLQPRDAKSQDGQVHFHISCPAPSEMCLGSPGECGQIFSGLQAWRFMSFMPLLPSHWVIRQTPKYRNAKVSKMHSTSFNTSIYYSIYSILLFLNLFKSIQSIHFINLPFSIFQPLAALASIPHPLKG